MEFDIIDFHTHPFITDEDNICSHTKYCNMSIKNTRVEMEKLGVSKICGSVISKKREDENIWENILRCNNSALELKELYGDFYVPGFHVHPDYVKESCYEIERMNISGVKLIGELVPYFHGWNDYSSKAYYEILDVAKSYGMIVSFHSMGEDEMDKMVKDNPDIIFVAAHPGEYAEFERHMERMKYSENYYIDLSGYGIFRHGMLKHAVDLFGAERFVFGSDFPTCNPGMYIGGVLFDSNLTDEQKEMIFYKNAKELLGI